MRDHWDQIAGRILGGLSHDINNRLTALLGFREIMAEPIATGHEMATLFDAELDRLGRVNRLLRRMAEADDARRVVFLGDVLDVVRALHDRYRHGRPGSTTWELPAALPAAELATAPFERGLLLLLAGACGVDPAVRVRADVGSDPLRLSIEPPAPADWSAAAEPWLLRAGVSYRWDPGASAILIPVPARSDASRP